MPLRITPRQMRLQVPTYNHAYINALNNQINQAQQIIQQNQLRITTIQNQIADLRRQINNISSLASAERSSRNRTALVEGVVGNMLVNDGNRHHNGFESGIGAALEIDAVMTASSRGHHEAQLDNLTYQQNSLSNDLYRLQRNNQNQQQIIQDKNTLIARVRNFINQISVNPQALYELNLQLIERILDDYEDNYPNQDEQIRYALYLLRAGIDIITLTNNNHPVILARRQYGYLVRVLWMTIEVLGTENLPEEYRVLSRGIADVLKNMHIGQHELNVPITQEAELEIGNALILSPFWNNPQNEFLIDEQNGYNDALELFNNILLNDQHPAMQVKRALLEDVQRVRAPNEERPNIKFYTRILNLQSYLLAPSPEKLEKVQELDGHVNGVQTAMEKYIQLTDLAQGHPEYQTLGKCMMVFGALLLITAIILGIILSVGAAVPAAALFTHLIIGFGGGGTASASIGAAFTFYGQRHGLSLLMNDFDGIPIANPEEQQIVI